MDFEAAKLPKPLADLYHYWQSKHSGRRLPSRADLNPVEMKGFLPHAILIDVVGSPRDDKRFRVRLAGTHIAESFHNEFTGKFVDELALDGREADVIHICGNIVHEMKPSYLAGKINWPSSREILSFEGLGVPLSSDGETVNIILAGALISKRRNPG